MHIRSSRLRTGFGAGCLPAAVVMLAAMLIAPAQAADLVFPTGSQLGIVPPAGHGGKP